MNSFLIVCTCWFGLGVVFDIVYLAAVNENRAAVAIRSLAHVGLFIWTALLLLLK